MTEGKRKSISLAGCNIGERTTPPALKPKGITQEGLVEKLLDLGLKTYLRITHKLDKPAAIKALAEDGRPATGRIGRQREAG
jgi:phage host-nuclease inhibitor protein Gam